MGGYDLVALIFAREINDNLTSLVRTIDKQLEQSAARRQGQGHNRFGVWVVFLSDDNNLNVQLQTLVAREGLNHVVVSRARDNAKGPPRYKVNPEAELTVVVYKDADSVVANHVLTSEELTVSRTKEIVQSLQKVLP